MNKSLFRYPGGKNKLLNQIIPLIENYFNKNDCNTYFEPFFGGGAVGLALLENPKINNYIFNDIDSALISLWISVQKYPNELIEKIETYFPNVEDFFQFKENLLKNSILPFEKKDIVELGFQKLVLHQISFSGLGVKAGSCLGGINQNSNYKIDCRWSINNLIKKIIYINKLFNQKNIEFLNKNILDEQNVYEKTFVYFDPPYVQKGEELYKHGFKESYHYKLIDYIKKLDNAWLLSYDDDILIKNLYKDYFIKEISINYSIKNATQKKELLIHEYDL